MVGRTKRKWSSFINLALLLAGVITINLIAEKAYKRFDLTKEKRFTLSKTSKHLVDQLDDVVYVNIFLEGEFPKEYKRLRNAARDMLNEFRIASGGLIEYDFEDVLADQTKEDKEEILQKLSSEGVQITQPEISPDETMSAERYIIPGGLVRYKNREFPLNLLKRKFGNELFQDINMSVEQLEYEIGNAIRMCLAERKTRLAFTEGHGELDRYDVADITTSLSDYYQVERINMNIQDTNCVKMFMDDILKDPENSGRILVRELSKTINRYDGLIVAKPRYTFLPEEQLILDQYVMQGGKILWLVESLDAEMDSINNRPQYITHDYPLGLDNILFRYGVRINPTLIQDLQCHAIPIMAGQNANRPVLWPWIYYPLFNSNIQHPIVRNLDDVWGRFVSSIDTLPAKDIKKTVLLMSSDSSRVANNPVLLSMHSLAVKPNASMFTKPHDIAAVLLEGIFTSPFAHRPAMKRNAPFQLVTRSEANKMVVIADGDIIRNQAKKETGEIYPLGYDRYASSLLGTQVTFANKKFFLNCVDYLCDDNNLIEVRSKKVEIRLLDKARVRAERVQWQLFNIVLPVVLIIILGMVNTFIRRRKYAR